MGVPTRSSVFANLRCRLQSTQNGEPCKSNGGGRCEKAREAQAGCCKGCGQWKSCQEGGQEKCQKGEENAGQDDQKQEDGSRVLQPQTESFKEYGRKACQKLLLIS